MSLLKKSRRGAAIVGSVFALGLGSVLFAAPASASSATCTVWSDTQTVGFSCQGRARSTRGLNARTVRGGMDPLWA